MVRVSRMTSSLMRRAIDLSIDSVKRGIGGPFAALVARQGEVIAVGVNQVATSNDPTAHAEVVAIRDACKQLNSFQLIGCEMYTTCEPCPMCLGAIYWARLDRIYFGNTRDDAARIGFDDAFIYDQMAVPILQRSIPMEPLMREQALEAFREWELATVKIRY